jgi:hypothetical protein
VLSLDDLIRSGEIQRGSRVLYALELRSELRDRPAIPSGVVIRRGLALRDAANLQFRRVRERARADSYHRGW